jgi:putative membrane protein
VGVGFLIRVAVNAVALWITTLIVPGIDLTGRSAWENVLTVIAVALIFGAVNAVLKPIIHFVGCIFYVFTLGLFALVVNALLFLLTDWFADRLELPFDIDGFWPAFWGALVMGIVSWAISLIISDRLDRR